MGRVGRGRAEGGQSAEIEDALALCLSPSLRGLRF